MTPRGAGAAGTGYPATGAGSHQIRSTPHPALLSRAMAPPRSVTTAPSGADAGGESLPAIARAAILDLVSRRKAPRKKAPPAPAGAASSAAGYLAQRRPVFVTLRDARGEIRACGGSVEPRTADLLEETRESARLAAGGDEFREPIRSAPELKKLSIEVSVLGPPERVESIIELDPEIYGVILTVTKTGRRGLMLPDRPGLNTVDKQLAAIRREAGIRPDERYRIERFRVETFRE